MLNVRLAGDHQYGKLLFTWLSVVMSLMLSFCTVFFPRDVLGEIWDGIDTVSGGFPTYSYIILERAWDLLVKALRRHLLFS